MRLLSIVNILGGITSFTFPEDPSIERIDVRAGGVFVPGSGIGGYLFWPINRTRDGKEVVEVWRVSGNEKTRIVSDPTAARAIVEERHEQNEKRHCVLVSGARGLLAQSAGAANNGIWHPVRKESALWGAMRRNSMSPRNRLGTISGGRVDGLLLGGSCQHRSDGSKEYKITSNAEAVQTITEQGQRVPETHHDHFHRGCLESPHTVALTGCKWAINWHGSRPFSVWVDGSPESETAVINQLQGSRNTSPR